MQTHGVNTTEEGGGVAVVEMKRQTKKQKQKMTYSFQTTLIEKWISTQAPDSCFCFARMRIQLIQRGCESCTATATHTHLFLFLSHNASVKVKHQITDIFHIQPREGGSELKVMLSMSLPGVCLCLSV